VQPVDAYGNPILRPGQRTAQQVNQQSWMIGLAVLVAILAVVWIVTSVGSLR
jgi:hypothetical protein